MATKIDSPKKTPGKSRFNPEGNILKMPSLSQGILDDLLPNHLFGATKKAPTAEATLSRSTLKEKLLKYA